MRRGGLRGGVSKVWCTDWGRGHGSVRVMSDETMELGGEGRDR